MKNQNYKCIHCKVNGQYLYAEVTPDGYLVEDDIEFETEDALIQISQSGVFYSIIELNGSKAIRTFGRSGLSGLVHLDTNEALKTMTFMDSVNLRRSVQYRMRDDQEFILIDCETENTISHLPYVSRTPLPKGDSLVAKALRKWLIREVNGVVSDDDDELAFEAPTKAVQIWVTIKDSELDDPITTRITVNRALHDEWVACSIAKTDSPDCLNFEFEVMEQAKAIVPNYDILNVYYGRKAIVTGDHTNEIVCSEM